MKHAFLKLAMPLLVSANLASAQNFEPGTYPKLPDGVKATHPAKNPLRDALLPVPKDAIFKMDGFYLWDPSVIEVDGTYHLFASRWPEKEKMKGWMHSEVIRASSKSLFGPYHFEEVVLSPKNHPWATQAVHNPKVTKVGGRFLIYHLGIPQWKTGFAYADRIEGPWKPLPKPVISTNNPSLLVRPDGSAYVVGKFKPQPTRDGQWDACMQAFDAPGVEGPYKILGDGGNRLPGNFELEDPTVWWQHGRYNVLCTDWESKVTGISKAVVCYTSSDGIKYDLYSQIPVWSQADPVPILHGEPLRVGGIERPQVFQDEKGNLTALLASIYPDGKNGPTFIMIRPFSRNSE